MKRHATGDLCNTANNRSGDDWQHLFATWMPICVRSATLSICLRTHMCVLLCVLVYVWVCVYRQTAVGTIYELFAQALLASGIVTIYERIATSIKQDCWLVYMGDHVASASRNSAKLINDWMNCSAVLWTCLWHQTAMSAVAVHWSTLLLIFINVSTGDDNDVADGFLLRHYLLTATTGVCCIYCYCSRLVACCQYAHMDSFFQKFNK